MHLYIFTETPRIGTYVYRRNILLNKPVQLVWTRVQLAVCTVGREGSIGFRYIKERRRLAV